MVVSILDKGIIMCMCVNDFYANANKTLAVANTKIWMGLFSCKPFAWLAHVLIEIIFNELNNKFNY